MKFDPLVKKAVELQSAISTLEHSNERRALGDLINELVIDIYYDSLRPQAQEMAWTCPNSKSPLDKSAWIRYWIGCDNLEKNPDAGRPIIPHRTGR